MKRFHSAIKSAALLFLAVTLVLCSSCKAVKTVPKPEMTGTFQAAEECKKLMLGKIHTDDFSEEDLPDAEYFTFFDIDSDGLPELMFLGWHKNCGNLYRISDSEVTPVSGSISGANPVIVHENGKYTLCIDSVYRTDGTLSYGLYTLSDDLSSVSEQKFYLASYGNDGKFHEAYSVADMKDFRSDKETEITESEFKSIEEKYSEGIHADVHFINAFNISKYVYETYGLNPEVSTEEIYSEALSEYFNTPFREAVFTGDAASSAAYSVDLNGDGYNEVIYMENQYPCVAYFTEGTFTCQKYGENIIVHGSFPYDSGYSGFWFDSEKGIVVIRETGGNFSNMSYHKAVAYLTDDFQKPIWEITGDEVNESPAETDKYYEAVNAQTERFNEKFDAAIKDYKLTDFFDVAIPLDTIVEFDDDTGTEEQNRLY